MTPQQKETLLEALIVLRDLSREYGQNAASHARHLCEKSKPVLMNLRTKGLVQYRKFHKRIASEKHLCKRVITIVAFTAVSTVAYQALPESSSKSSTMAASPPVGEAAPKPTIDSRKNIDAVVAKRIEAARRDATFALQKARAEQQAAQAQLAAEKRTLEASEKARQAEITAQKAEHRARVARIQSSRTRSNADSVLLGIQSNRPVELGFGTSSRTPSGYRSQSVNRDMQRYQRHMSGTMAARGVR